MLSVLKISGKNVWKAAVFCWCCVALTTNGGAQTAVQLQSDFGNPPAQYRMGVRYWWWGSKVDSAELAWQLGQMKDQGIMTVEEVGVYAAASGATVALGSAQWVQNVKALIHVASNLGMFVYVNPGTAWPWCYNGAEPMANAASCSVRYQSTRLTGSQTWTGAVPKPTLNGDGRLWQVTLTRAATSGLIDPVIDSAQVLTHNVGSNNSITVSVPSGEWILTGFWLQPVKYGGDPDGPQPDNDGPTVGFEDSGSVHAQLNWLIQPVLSGLNSSLVGTTFKGIYCDNLEDYGSGIGRNFGAQFQALRTWDLIKYLPVLFYKSTQGDGIRVAAEYNAARGMCFAQYGFGGARQWAAQKGLTFRGEGHDWYYWADNYGNADIPEFENYGGPLGRIHYGQKARAGANLYGRRIVSCESFTRLDGDGDTDNPSVKLMNQAMNNIMGVGANKIMMHGYTYAPSNRAWTKNFRASSRFNHWHPFFPLFRGFADYVANNSCVLQQGKPVVEVLSMGKDTSIGYSNSQIKEDPCSEAGFLQNTFTVGNGTIGTPMVAYKILIVKDTIRYVETLRKLDTMIHAGANVLFTNGMVAGRTPYYYGGRYAAVNDEMAAIKSRIYDVITGAGPVTVGSGKVWSTRYDTPQAVLASLNIKADVIGPSGWQTVAGEYPFQHRRGDDYDAYFLNNNNGASGTWQLRAAGKAEEWDAVTGRITPINFTSPGEYTTVNLTGGPNESRIIVIRHDKEALSPNLDSLYYTAFQTITGTWQVIFTNNFRTPVDTIKLTTLTDWAGVSGLSSSFVGVATYSLSFNLTTLPQADRDVVIDLGTIYDIADVTINGTKAGYTWKAPYRVYVTGLLKTGDNQLTIRVGSRWYKSGLGRGLLGPVTLRVASIAFPATAAPSIGDRADNRFNFAIRSKNRATIVFSKKADYRITIRDIGGRTVNEYSAANVSRFTIPVAAYAPGVYMVSISCKKEVHQTKWVRVR